MSTRGSYGFRKNGIDKLTYNHSDSYPEWLGKEMVDFCRSTPIEQMNIIYDSIIMVSAREKPTRSQIKKCAAYYDKTVSDKTINDWYCLLRNTQGNLAPYKNGLRYMLNYGNFVRDSLFCEYAYIINLDTEKLEFWVGYQRKPSPGNRYGTEADDGYYPCAQVAEFDLCDLPAKIIEDMCKAKRRSK